jgi:hypothetical protein
MKPTSIAYVVFCVAVAQGQPSDQFAAFLESLMANPRPSDVPSNKIESATVALETAPAADVRRALVVADRAAAHPDLAVRRAAMAAFWRITATRADGADLLQDHLGVLERFLADEQSADIALLTLAYLRPLPPTEVTRIFLRYSERTDVPQERQSRALGVALQREESARRRGLPGSPEDVLSAVERFAMRTLDHIARSRLMDGIALVQPVSPRVTAVVKAAMKRPEASVRARALYNLGRLGRFARFCRT